MGCSDRTIPCRAPPPPPPLGTASQSHRSHVSRPNSALAGPGREPRSSKEQRRQTDAGIGGCGFSLSLCFSNSTAQSREELIAAALEPFSPKPKNGEVFLLKHFERAFLSTAVFREWTGQADERTLPPFSQPLLGFDPRKRLPFCVLQYRMYSDLPSDCLLTPPLSSKGFVSDSSTWGQGPCLKTTGLGALCCFTVRVIGDGYIFFTRLHLDFRWRASSLLSSE